MSKYLSSVQGFLGIPKEDAAPAKSPKVVVIPFGLENSVSYGHGTKLGPAAILKASHQVELFDEELWKEPHRSYSLSTRKAVPIRKSISDALKQLESIVAEEVADKKFPLILGGEHALTPGAIRPLLKKHKKLSLLHFDAHADLRDGYAGERYSHAAALRRCLDYPGVNLVSIGIRNLSAPEAVFYEKNRKRVSIFWGKDRKKWKIADILRALGDNPVYITFDIDGFDSSVMPATGTPEPGGFFWEDAMQILRAACEKKNVVGGDIVELAPQKGMHGCDFLTAKLAFKILAYRFALSNHSAK